MFRLKINQKDGRILEECMNHKDGLVRILHKLQYLHKDNPNHLHSIWISSLGYSSIAQGVATPFPLPM